MLPNSSERIDLRVQMGGEVYWCDVQVVVPSATSYLPGSANDPGYAAHRAEKSKLSRWRAVREKGGHSCKIIPMIFESTGRRGDMLESFCASVRNHSGEAGRSINWLWNQLAVTLQKCNADMVAEAMRKAKGITPSRDLCWLRRRR